LTPRNSNHREFTGVPARWVLSEATAAASLTFIGGLMSATGEVIMNKDRIAGAAKQAQGSVKETIGKAVGDAKLRSDGKAEKVEGKVQNAIGGLKDALKK
jgi:uncharacterized protein YjbJ (UPF0337 family)